MDSPEAAHDPAARAHCPQCGRRQRVTAADAGLTLICPACGHRFPAPPVVAPAVAPVVSPPPSAGDDRSLGAWLVGLVIVVVVAGGAVAALWHLDRRPPLPAVRLPVVPKARPPARHTPATRPSSKLIPVTRPWAAPTRPAVVRPATVPVAMPTMTPAAAAPPRIRIRPPLAPPPDLDDQIGHAIDHGIDYLLTRFRGGRLPEAKSGEGIAAGANALAVYALLQAAQATDRPDLHVDSPAVTRMLDALRSMPMSEHYTTYDRSLRAAALAVYNRKADRQALRADAAFLMAQSRDGAYTYDPLPPPRTGGFVRRRPRAFPEGTWDNSNSQYGALGVWSALDAGVEVPGRYWEGVRQHWLATQLANGMWTYTSRAEPGRLSMTVAGITTLLVAEDQLGATDVIEHMGRSPYTPAVTRGLAWLEAGDHAVDLPEDWPTYVLYGVERAALASGFKTFGRHDWYRELAARQLPLQQADGAWAAGTDPLIDTAFELLFLARGRHPILMDKLRFDGAWANRPQDLAHLAAFASKELERPMNWQVVSATDAWQSWMDAPVLYLASYKAPALTDDQYDKLRTYAENGGLIFTSNDSETPAFDHFVADLAARLFPRYKLHDLPANDPVYRSLFPLNHSTPPRLRGVSNGSRLLLVQSPGDLGKTWQLRETVTHPAPFQLGLNLFIDAAGKANFQNKLRTTYVPQPTEPPTATTAIARVQYDGDWDPEPAAAGRFARVFQNDTGVAVTLIDADPDALSVRTTPMALLTGTGDVTLSRLQLRALHRYVADGGVLLADACGGSVATRRALLERVLPGAFPEITPRALSADHPILAGTLPGMAPLDPKLRPFAADLGGTRTFAVQAVAVGKGLVLFCPVDVTTGLLGTNTWGVNGYDPAAAYGLARNALLYAAERPF